ncbi:MAG: transglutaminase-like domain-containing protein [Anaerolineales bacterium]
MTRAWRRVDRTIWLPLMAGGYGLVFLLLLNAAVQELPFSSILTYALLSALLTRMILASRWKTVFRLVVLAFSGVGIVFTSSARLLGPLAAFIGHYSSLTSARAAADLLQIDLQLIGSARQLALNLDAFLANLSIWWQNLLGGTAVHLRQPATFVWGLVVFAVAAWMRWHLHRSARPLLAVLPGIMAAAVLVNFGDNTRYYFGLLLACGVMVWTLFSHAGRQASWEQKGYGYSDELWLDIGWPSVWAAAFVFALTVINPTLSIREIANRVEQWSERRDAAGSNGLGSGDVSSALGVYESQPEEDADGGKLPNSHLLTDSPELRDTLLFEVRVSGEAGQAGVGTLYWRTQTFETYTGHGWQSGPVRAQELPPNQPTSGQLNPDPVFTDLSIQVRAEQAAGVLVYAHQFVSVNQPVTLLWRQTPAGAPDLFAGTLQAESYTVRTVDSALPENRLETSPAMSAWVWRTYLQLPEELPVRVTQLAQEIVRGQVEPFAKAQAIQNYLRQYPYTLEVPLPPSNQDVVDYFLFELQQGYCDYYATAMVVLARSVGLPARLVVGYAQGTFDPESGAYRVTGEEAHTWVEVYFSELGWVEFEPTAGRPLLVRGSVPEGGDSGAQAADESAVLRLHYSDWLAALPLAALSLLFAGFAAARFRLAAQHPVALLNKVKAQCYRLAEACALADPQMSTLNEISSAIQGFVSTRFQKAGLRWAGKQVQAAIESSVALLSEVAYQGVSPELIENKRLGCPPQLKRLYF